MGPAFTLLLALIIASERVEVRERKFPAPGDQRCVRLHADGLFKHAIVVVNKINSGQLADHNAELDITGYLSSGGPNSIEVRGDAVERVWVWLSPLVYIASAHLQTGSLEVTISNTTENTAQVEIGEHQFTVSPGTSATRRLSWTGTRRIRMHAFNDGLDREFVDEAEATEAVIR